MLIAGNALLHDVCPAFRKLVVYLRERGQTLNAAIEKRVLWQLREKPPAKLREEGVPWERDCAR